MTELLLFHHVQGLTEGIRRLADLLRREGHTVHTPDLYEGRNFATIEKGLLYAEGAGFQTILERAGAAAEELPAQIVYAGVSLGVLPAQMLTQTRGGAVGAILFSAAIPPSEFGGGWPAGVPLQIHMMEHDPLVVDEGDLDAARGLLAEVQHAELFLYPGDRHLFIDDSLPDHDPAAAALALERVQAFLASVA